MTIQRVNYYSFLKISFVVFISLFSSFSMGDHNSGRDKALVIKIDPVTHCAISVEPANHKQDCKLESPNPCKNDPECICSKKEKYIVWTASTEDKFDINFPNGTPFKRCNYKSENAGEIRCKIKNDGDFYYEVNIEGCANNPYDPRIVVH